MRTSIAVIILGALSVLAPLADLVGFAPLKGLAAATGASPAMKVFTSHEGYETFSPRFHLQWREAGQARGLVLTPTIYANLRGPYNRRNAYGAVLAYSPVLSANPNTRAMHAEVVRYALCGDAPVLAELGIDRNHIDGPMTVRIEPRRQLHSRWQLEYQADCNE